MTTVDRGRGPRPSLFDFEDDDIEKITDPFGGIVWRRKDTEPDNGSLSFPKNHPVTRMRKAWRRGDLFEQVGDEPFSLKNAVGPEAENLPTDVARVQTALGRTGTLDLAETDGPTGLFNGLLGERIEKAQRDGGKKVDATVSPGGETILMLKQLAQNKPLKPSLSPARSRQFAGTKTGGTSPIIPVPRYRRFVISKQKDPKSPNKNAWDEFSNAVINLPSSTRVEQRAYAEVFAAEGGVLPDPTDANVVAGISPQTLAELSRAKVIDPAIAAKTPAALTMPERVHVMRGYLDLALNKVGGHRAINRINDEEVAAAFVDTLYRHGRNRGAAIVQLAIEKVTGVSIIPGFKPKLTGSDSVVGPATLKSFENVAKSPGTRRQFLDAVAFFRGKDKPFETDRFNHFRFLTASP